MMQDVIEICTRVQMCFGDLPVHMGTFPPRRYTKCPPNHWLSSFFTNLTQQRIGNAQTRQVLPGVSDVLGSKQDAHQSPLQLIPTLPGQKFPSAMAKDLVLQTFFESLSTHLTFSFILPLRPPVCNVECSPGSYVRNLSQSVLESFRRKIRPSLPYLSFLKPVTLMTVTHSDDVNKHDQTGMTGSWVSIEIAKAE